MDKTPGVTTRKGDWVKGVVPTIPTGPSITVCDQPNLLGGGKASAAAEVTAGRGLAVCTRGVAVG